MAADSPHLDSDSGSEPTGADRVTLTLRAGDGSGPSPLGHLGDSDHPTEPLTGPAAEVRALPHLGEKIDGYRLLESIGAGGMGAVFRAVDLGLDRQVALKILPPEQAVDPEVVRRFHQEGRAAAKLDHENIARVYAIGDDSRFHYIAFEYIEGMNVRQRVGREGSLTTADAVHLTRQIAQALVHSAEREVVHRDIKPSNIIVTPTGRAKLVDMGLARSFERRGEADLTQTGMTLGTFDYISPEQARDPRDVDIRGDLYSLGCTLFYMLSGRPPFPEGTVLQKLLQHRDETPIDIRRLNAAVPDALAAIVARLLAKDRERRYQTPESLIRDLSRVPTRKFVALPSVRATPTWARHLVWTGPSLIFLLIFLFFLYWGDEPLPSLPLARTTPSPTATATPGPAPVGALALNPGSGGVREPDAGRSAARLDLPAPSAAPATGRAVAVGPNEDLARTLAEAPRRSTVVLVGRGPFELRPSHLVRLIQADLTIRGGDEARPLIRLVRDPTGPLASGGAGAPALVAIQGGRVTFDGLDFLLDPAGFAAPPAERLVPENAAGSPPPDLAALTIEDAEVTVRRCSFRRLGSLGGGLGVGGAGGAAPRVAAIRLVGTPRVGPPGRGLADAPLASLVVEASEFEGNQIALLASGHVDVAIHDGAFGPTLADQATFWVEGTDPTSAVPAEFRLDHVSGLLGQGPMFRFRGTTPRVLVRHSAFGPVAAPGPDSGAGPTLVAIDVPGRLDYRGADNLFARVGTFLRGLSTPGGPPPTTVRSWAAWADDPTLPRESGSAAFDGLIWEHPPATSLNLTVSTESPRSFRMVLPRAVAHHPGARWGPTGPLSSPAYLGRPLTPNRVLAVPPDRPTSRLAPLREAPPAPGVAPTSQPSGAEPTPDTAPTSSGTERLVPMPLPVPMPMPMPLPGTEPNLVEALKPGRRWAGSLGGSERGARPEPRLAGAIGG